MGARPGDEGFADLALAGQELWKRLVRASRDRRSPWHTPVVATVGTDGAPRARVMVLRAVEPDTRSLRLHTDLRAAKVAELARDARVALLFYDAPGKLQLRVEGRGWIESHGEAAEAAWDATRPFSRRCYIAPIAPGTPAERPVSGLPDALEGREPTVEESEAGRPNFAILRVEAQVLEFLHLAVTGHRRAILRWREDRYDAGWLIP